MGTAMLENSSYVKDVESFFLALTGRGLMLSAKDYELIQSWRRAGVPRDVVYRGISRAVENLGAFNEGRTPSSLMYCERSVEEEISEYHKTGPTPAGPGPAADGPGLREEVMSRLAELVTESSDTTIGHIFARALEEMRAMAADDDGELYFRVEELQDSIVEGIFETIGTDEQEKIRAEAAATVPEGGRHMTRHAYDETVRFYRHKLVMARHPFRSILHD